MSRSAALVRFFQFFVGAMLVASCSTDANSASTDTVDSGETSESGSQGMAVPDRDDGLVADLRGIVDGTTMCPGGTQPCVALDRVPDHDDPSGVGASVVRVQFIDGVATVLFSEALESPLNNFTDRCEDTLPEADFNRLAALSQADQEAAEEDGTYAYDLLDQYGLTVPDAYAVRWLSGSGRVHFGVVGDAEPHREALQGLGIADVVCVVGGFEASDSDLARVQDEVGDMLSGWSPLDEGAGWGRDGFAGAVVVDMYRVDQSMLAESEDRFGDLVQLNGAWTVLNGSLDDLDLVLDQIAAAPTSASPGLSASCGAVVFSSVPPDVDEFPALDDDVQMILDDFMTGPLSVETGFIEGLDWSVALQTEARLVLFGQSQAKPGDYADVTFEMVDGTWRASGWGGCAIDVSAPGYGSATTILNPDHEPDPASVELHLWIMERECASGQAPVDRDVVPVITETETTVEISTLVAPVAGSADCPSNPWHPIVATLSTPLGERQVIDTQTPPGVERSWPPSDEELSG